MKEMIKRKEDQNIQRYVTEIRCHHTYQFKYQNVLICKYQAFESNWKYACYMRTIIDISKNVNHKLYYNKVLKLKYIEMYVEHHALKMLEIKIILGEGVQEKSLIYCIMCTSILAFNISMHNVTNMYDVI